MRNDERVFAYNGPVLDGACKTTPQSQVSPANALEIIREAVLSGRMQISVHFKQRCIERGFDTLDADNAIRTGLLRGDPEYCAAYRTWKYRIVATVEDREFEIVVALDPSEDYSKSPLIILVTGYWR